MSSTDTGSERGASPEIVNLSATVPTVPRRDDEDALVRASRQRLAAQLIPPMLRGALPVGGGLHVGGRVPQLLLERRSSRVAAEVAEKRRE